MIKLFQQASRKFITTLLIVLALCVSVALISYSADDPSWSRLSSHTQQINNSLGSQGAWFSDILYNFIGIASWWLVIIILYETLLLWANNPFSHGAWRIIGYFFLVISSAGLFVLVLPTNSIPQGIIGQIVGLGLSNLIGKIQAITCLVLFMLMTLLLIINLPWEKIFFKKSEENADDDVDKVLPNNDLTSPTSTQTATKRQIKKSKKSKETPQPQQYNPVTAQTVNSPPVIDTPQNLVTKTQAKPKRVSAYRANLTAIPTIDLLDKVDNQQNPIYTNEQLQQLALLLEKKLADFKIPARVIDATVGPIVTRFEVELASGVTANKVTNISRDIARSLSKASVRVVEVIPNKPYIGIEVANPKRQIVRLIELLNCEDYHNPASRISMAMGKDIAGYPVIADLANAPHMLIAGTTGAGKSVLVNAILLSILLKYTPEQVRLMLIDPKQLELASYQDIPHLLSPVITDMNDVVANLTWCVAEMERRYSLMASQKVHKIDDYNQKIRSEGTGEILPFIVIIIDEFADLMMQIGKPVEGLITRLTQKSHVAGIHIVLATQRPSVAVITGLIKVNIPVRVGLRVNSKIDSRTILDSSGAEDMLGNGDMLFLDVGTGQQEPIRIHGAYVSNEEINHVCDAWRERGNPQYIDIQ